MSTPNALRFFALRMLISRSSSSRPFLSAGGGCYIDHITKSLFLPNTALNVTDMECPHTSLPNGLFRLSVPFFFIRFNHSPIPPP